MVQAATCSAPGMYIYSSVRRLRYTQPAHRILFASRRRRCRGRTEAGLNAHILHQAIGAEDARGEDGDGRLGGAVRGAKGAEDDGRGASHGAEEGL